MAEKNEYYILSPPFSQSEHFIKVNKVATSEKDGNVYVYYEYILNEMEDNIEKNHFEKCSKRLTEKKLINIEKNIKDKIENIKKETSKIIEDLEDRKKDFQEVLSKIKEDKKEKDKIEEE